MDEEMLTIVDSEPSSGMVVAELTLDKLPRLIFTRRFSFEPSST